MRAFAYVLLIGFCLAADLISDIFIRGKGLDGQNGINAAAWDVTASIGILVGLALLAIDLLMGD